MWLIFDLNENLVGMIVGEDTGAVYVLEEADYIAKWVDNLTNFNETIT